MYLYIISLDNQQNRVLFNNAIDENDGLKQQKRYRESFKIKTKNDVLDFETPQNSLLFGADYLLLKVIEDQFNESMLVGATDYEIYTESNLQEAKEKFYL